MNRNLFATDRRGWSVLTLLAAALFLSSGPQAVAQDDGNNEIEEIVATGTRKEGQSPTETLSPIDVVGGESLAELAAFDMTDGFTKVSPAINTQRFPIADGTAFIRPVSLRNLSPDQTLVLVNGTRRHRSPLVNLQLAPLGTVNQGAQAVDYSVIPAAAVKRVEVLRDGASAQYGSDAIAGVINIILKDASEGVSLSGQTGEYFEGDGARTSVSANAGFGLGDSGFINATIEYSESETTSRGVPHFACPGVSAVVGIDVVPLDGLCQRWGDPDVETLKGFVNFGAELNENISFFGHASVSNNDTVSDFFYRNPVLDPSAGISGRSTLIVDTDGDFIPDPAPQSLVDNIAGQGLNVDDYLTADAGSPSGYVLLNPIYTQFPGGYNPDFGAGISDGAIVLGFEGDTDNDISWSFKGRYAQAEADYTLSETINPSLGGTSPTSFKPGKLTQEETSVNFDVVVPLTVEDFASPINVAWGFEWRDETYTINAGDEASISAGPVFIFGVGSDGFQGFPRESAGSFNSDSISAYIDTETDITDKFTLGAALRYEDYDSFGDTTNFKLSGRYQFTDNFALRGTVSTGFRAPTPGQINTLNVTTSADASGNLIPSGTYPVDNPVAQVLGATPLDAEESRSVTLGAVWQVSDTVDITIDVYDISIDDRIALFGPNTISAADAADLAAAGVPNAALLEGSLASFFTNGFDSRVKGIDIAITTTFELNSGDLLLDIRHNTNEQEVRNVVANTINTSRVFDLENQIPDDRTTVTLDYETSGMFGGYLRLNKYSDWSTTGGLFSPGDASDAFRYGGELIVDAEARFQLNDIFSFAVGGENIFDTEPDDENDFVLGLLGANTAITSPFGNNGGFWYLRLNADF